MDRPIHIYMLTDPRTDEPYYVGRTVNPGARHATHMSMARSNNWYEATKPVALHTASILLEGLEPRLEILETVQGDAWRDAEAMWLEHFKGAGCPMKNLRRGGQGNPDYHRGIPEIWRKYLEEHLEEFIPPGYCLVPENPTPQEA